MATDRDGRPRLLYLITNEVSQVLIAGQLSFLAEQGFEVRLGIGRDRTAPGRTPWDGGVQVDDIPFVREVSPVRDLRALVATVRLIRRTRPDVVNASTPKAGLLGMLAAAACRVPVRVYVVRGLRMETMSGRGRRVHRLIEKVTTRCATHVVFNSASLRSLAEREGIIGVGRGEVLAGGSGNGVDTRRFTAATPVERSAARQRFGLGPDGVVVGYVGRFTHDKGIADLVTAFRTHIAPNPHVTLMLVGRFEDGDPLPDDVRSAIESDARIVVVPWLDEPSVAYHAIDILAFPSYREGLPNAPLQAQASGVPVVGYAATGTVDAVHDLSTLVPTGDVDGLGRRLIELIDSPARRTELGAAGARWVHDRFDQRRLWNLLADRYLEWSARASDPDADRRTPDNAAR